MRRSILGWACVVICCALTGCTMCCHRNDYCGPVYEDGCATCSNSCSKTYRAGSILGGDYQSELAPQPAIREPNRQVPTPAKPKPAPGTTASAGVHRHKPVSSQRTSMAANGRTPQQPARGQMAQFDVVNGKVTGRVDGQVKTGDVPGSERIVSVTDRSASEPASSAVPSTEGLASTEASSDDVAPESALKLPTGGWMARRPSTSVLR